MSPSRLETFADGVFAIAATLLILNVDTQIAGDLPNLGDRLLHIWPSYLAYAVSFVTIGIMTTVCVFTWFALNVARKR